MRSHREKVSSKKKRERAKNLRRMLTFCGLEDENANRVERGDKEKE